MTIEVLLSTRRSLAGATRALLDRMLGPGFQNIDPPETRGILVELMNVDGEEWARRVPEELSAQDLGELVRGDREILRARVELRLGFFLLFPGFVVLSRPDDYEDFVHDPRARHIIGREALEIAHAFAAEELIVAGDAASDFLGSEATTWDGLKDVLEEEEIPHEVIRLKT